MSPFSNRLTVPLTTSPIAGCTRRRCSRAPPRGPSGRSPAWRSGRRCARAPRSASGTPSRRRSRCCWRPRRRRAAGTFRARRRARSGWPASVTSCTTVLSANRSTWPVSMLKRVFRFSPGLVVLARRRRDRLLDGGDHDIGLDALFLGQRFDGLLQWIRHLLLRGPYPGDYSGVPAVRLLRGPTRPRLRTPLPDSPA